MPSSSQTELLGDVIVADADAARSHAEDGARFRVLRIRTDADAKRSLVKREHDMKNAVRTLRLALESIRGGYKFDDDKAQAKLASLEKAVVAMEGEADLMRRILAE